MAEGNAASLFRFYRCKTGISRSIPPLKVGDDFVCDTVAKASILNEIFISNSITDNLRLPAMPFRNSSDREPCDSVQVTVTEVYSILTSIKPSLAVGPEGFSAYFYRELRSVISVPLAHIFQLSLKTSRIPDIWSTANVTPIFKKGNAADPNNYRPIALTAVPCKVLERIIRDNMYSYCKKHQLINDDQFGFLPGRSATHQLLLALDSWTQALDIGIPTDEILFDFKKAFESVVHSKLLGKLKSYGFDGNLLAWIEAFLTNRTQRVVLENRSSPELKIVSGVPQGSVLGPFLFLIYINDLVCNPFNADQKKFADDLKLHSAIICSNNNHLVQEEINYISKWALDWQLPISETKSKCFHIGRSNPHHVYNISGVPLPGVNLTKDLGIWFDSGLKSSAHCDRVVADANRRLGLVRRVFTSGCVRTRLWAFKVYVRPILEYASQVWSPYLLRDIDHLESVQRGFTRSLPGMRHLPYQHRLKSLGLDSLELRRLKADLILTYKIIHGLLPIDLPLFEFSHVTWTRGHSMKLSIPKYKLACRGNFFAVRVVPVWNFLDESTVLASSVGVFRRRIGEVDLTRFLKRPHSSPV